MNVQYSNLNEPTQVNFMKKNKPKKIQKLAKEVFGEESDIFKGSLDYIIQKTTDTLIKEAADSQELIQQTKQAIQKNNRYDSTHYDLINKLEAAQCKKTRAQYNLKRLFSWIKW